MNIKIRLLLLLAIFTCSCKKCVDYGLLITERVVNNSSHSIEVKLDFLGTTHKEVENFVLMPNEALYFNRIKHWSTEPYIDISANLELPHRAEITFDRCYRITHQISDKGNPHNFCNEEYYERKKIKKSHLLATFTITDADYDYAVEHGTRLE